MYATPHKPKQAGSGANKGSSADLMTYLNKENEVLSFEEQNSFFNQHDDDISLDESILLIDKNVEGSKLSSDEVKFYMLSIDPSHSELKHMILKTTGKDVDNFDLLSNGDKEKFYQGFQSFVNNSMGHYAELMDREVNGKKLDLNDLVYTAKIETQRIYKPESKEVVHNQKLTREIKDLLNDGEHKNSKKIDDLTDKYKRNKAGDIIKSGMKKDGLNLHAHVVVSRMDKEQTTKMSPWAKQIRSENHKVGDKECKIGFSRHDFSLRVENQFDNQFEYKRTFDNSTFYKLKQEREAKSNNPISAGTAISSYNRLMTGRFDSIEFIEFAAKVGYKMAKTITDTALGITTAGTTTTAKVVNDIAKMNPEQWAKMASGSLNAKEDTLVSLSKINPLDNIKSTANFKIKEIIKSGGME